MLERRVYGLTRTPAAEGSMTDASTRSADLGGNCEARALTRRSGRGQMSPNESTGVLKGVRNSAASQPDVESRLTRWQLERTPNPAGGVPRSLPCRSCHSTLPTIVHVRALAV